MHYPGNQVLKVRDMACGFTTGGQSPIGLLFVVFNQDPPKHDRQLQWKLVMLSLKELLPVAP
jgi:hypothetical protein